MCLEGAAQGSEAKTKQQKHVSNYVWQAAAFAILIIFYCNVNMGDPIFNMKKSEKIIKTIKQKKRMSSKLSKAKIYKASKLIRKSKVKRQNVINKVFVKSKNQV